MTKIRLCREDIFKPDTERNGVPFDYAEELLANPDNIELEIKRRQPARSATGEIHPNTSSKLPSTNNIAHFTEKSTETAKKVSEDGVSVRLSLKDGANQQASEDIDELMRSAGIEDDAAEIREDLAELYVKAENLAMDEDARKGKTKAFIKRVANRIALNMARLGYRA